MSTLYIDRQNTRLSTSAGTLTLHTDNPATTRKIPFKYLKTIVIRANLAIQSRDLVALTAAGIGTVMISGRARHNIAHTIGTPHANARTRWQQTLLLADPIRAAALAHAITQSKIKRQLNTLRHIQSHRPDIRKPLHDGIRSLTGTLHTLASRTDHSLQTIRGLEGAAAAHYFPAYFAAFPASISNGKRSKRPPTDAVNAILSLSYTLLYAQAQTACWSAGLDPALGALHTISYGRDSLACDLIEPFRPLTDRWVWEQFRARTLRADHFSTTNTGAVLLGKAGRSHYYQAWEAHSSQTNKTLLRYTRALAQSIQQQQPLTLQHLL